MQAAQQECPIEKALEEQWLRTDIGANVHSRRIDLNMSLESFSKMLDCSTSDLTRMEEGVLFYQMPFLRMQALMLLERLESREEGRRNGDTKQPFMRRVK